LLQYVYIIAFWQLLVNQKSTTAKVLLLVHVAHELIHHALRLCHALFWGGLLDTTRYHARLLELCHCTFTVSLR
jgi:hypothetical protein